MATAKTAASRRHMNLLHTLRCVVCLNRYGRSSVVDELHHVEAYRGDHSDFATVPLCKSCHDDLHHRHRRAFYSAHNLDDVKLLAWTIKLIEEAMCLK